MYTNFEGGARAKKECDFWPKFSKKCRKPSIFGLFSKICLRPGKIGQIRVFIVVGESSENQFGWPKKNVDKVFKTFLKIPPPREIPRSAPASVCVKVVSFVDFGEVGWIDN